MKLLLLSLFIFLPAIASESEVPGKSSPTTTSNSSQVEEKSSSDASEASLDSQVSSDFAEETKNLSLPEVAPKKSPEKNADGEISLPPDFEMRNDNISDKYLAGAFLVYDCEEKHWVCVLEEDYKICEEKRNESIKKKDRQLPCAPIGEFPTKKSCFQRELFMAGHAHGSRFCLLDEIKKEELE